MTSFGTVGYDLRRAGRLARVGYGLLISAGAGVSTVVSLGNANDPASFGLQTVILFSVIAAAYLTVYRALGERLFARANPWLNTLILVGPAFVIGYWNITVGDALGVELPAPVVLALFAYVGLSMLLEAAIGYGGCEVVALPILVFRRRYVTYCLPIVMVDAAERGWMESAGLRRSLWITLGLASLATIGLGIVGLAPATVSVVAFALVAALIGVLAYLEGRARRRTEGPAHKPDLDRRPPTQPGLMGDRSSR